MLDVKHCGGCQDDFYNGKNPYGVKECWMRKDAKLVSRKLIPIDLAPPYSHIRVQQVPNCYRKQRYATVTPESLDSKGYWRTSMKPRLTPEEIALANYAFARERNCADCGEPIPAKRLAAVPLARYCRPCQEAHDRRVTAESCAGMAVMGEMDDAWTAMAGGW